MYINRTAKAVVFLSTLSLRRATGKVKVVEPGFVFLSTLSLRRATTVSKPSRPKEQFLSTLSLRRATAEIAKRSAAERNFYPRSPCGERQNGGISHIILSIFLSTLSLRRATSGCSAFCWLPPLFLSTLSLRRATVTSMTASTWQAYFYPRSPCGERRGHGYTGHRRVLISIHALLAESDAFCQPLLASVMQFLSTLSLRRATAKVHKTVGHFCAYETNFMEIASSC